MPELNEKNLKKLERLFAVMDDDTLTRKEFAEAFEKVVNLVLKIQRQQSEAIDAMERFHTQMTQKLGSDYTASAAELRKELLAWLTPKMEAMRREHEMMMRKAEIVRDGKDADEGKIVQDVLAQIKLPEQKEIILDGPKELRDKLEGLKDDERMDISAVKGLNEKLKQIQEAILNIPRGGRMGMRKVPIIRSIRLTGDVDGSTRAFNMPRDTVRVLGLWGTQFPITFDDNDWSLSGNTLTLADQITTPQAGQTLIAIIETLFYA